MTTEATTETAGEEAASATTNYAVLQFVEERGLWNWIGTQNARSAESAIRKAAATGGEGLYTAVPVRSWTEKRVTTETTTTMKLS